MTAHILVSVLGIMVLAAYTAATKKSWKLPVPEVLMRAFYGIALVTGIVVMNVQSMAAIAIVHKVAAGLFVLLLVVLFVHKLIASKKA